jgi:hypothetical protein
LKDAPKPAFREVETPTRRQEDVMNIYKPEDTVMNMQWDDFKQQMTPALTNLVVDYFEGGKPLSSSAKDQIDYIAERMGIYDVSTYLAFIERAYYNSAR